MKNRMFTAVGLIAGILAVSGSILAHHGTGISYDLTIAPVTAKATVTEFKWSNPHIGIYVDIKDDTGHVENWSIEGNSPYNWARMGWNRKTLQVGQSLRCDLRFESKAQPTYFPVATIRLFCGVRRWDLNG